MSFKSRNLPSQHTIENVDLPTTIKCIVCNRNKIQLRYSKNQLRKYKEKIYSKGALKAERPTCLECTGTPSMELQCADCGIFKSLDDFSKNARSKDRDNAHCWDCQQKVSDVEPIIENQLKEQEILEEYESRSTSAFSDMIRMGSSLPTGSKNSSAQSDTGTGDSGRVWIQRPISPGGAANFRGRSRPNVSKENSYQRSKSQESTATAESHNVTSATSTIGTWANIQLNGTPCALRDNASTSATSRGTAGDKWFKQGAVRKSAEEKAMDAARRSERQEARINQQRPREDDDSDDSDAFEI